MLRRILLRKSYEIDYTPGPIYKKLTGVGNSWSYAAEYTAEDNTFYEFEGDWFYVAKNLGELIWQMRTRFPWVSTSNPNSRASVTDINGLTKSIPMNNLITTRLTDMSNLHTTYNQFIGNWDVSNVTSMQNTFRDKSYNPDISGWCVENVTNMQGMFYNAKAFNQDLSGWCVELIPEWPHFFYSAYPYNWTLPKPVWGTCP